MARALVLAVPLALAALGGVYWYANRSASHALETTPGQPEGALVVPGEHGATLVIVDRVARGAYRLAALDPDTGKAVNQRVIHEPTRCWPASTGRMWCGDDAGRTHLVAVPSLDAVTASDADAASRTWLGHPEAGCTYGDVRTIGGDHLVFGDGLQRRALVRHAAHDGAEPREPAPPGALELLAPSFLVVDDPALVLVVHDVALDRPGVRAVTRVDDALHAAWTAELPARCETAHRVGDRLVITTSDPAARALAFDLATGKLAWRFAF